LVSEFGEGRKRGFGGHRPAGFAAMSKSMADGWSKKVVSDDKKISGVVRSKSGDVDSRSDTTVK